MPPRQIHAAVAVARIVQHTTRVQYSASRVGIPSVSLAGCESRALPASQVRWFAHGATGDDKGHHRNHNNDSPGRESALQDGRTGRPTLELKSHSVAASAEDKGDTLPARDFIVRQKIPRVKNAWLEFTRTASGDVVSRRVFITQPFDDPADVEDTSRRRRERETDDAGGRKGVFQRAKEAFLHKVYDVFFPKGYPQTVTPNFMSYSKWQATQTAVGAMTGVLSTQALLYAVGLGAGSIPVAAAVNWVVKDGLGQLGGVLYATFVNNEFDSDPKRHRFQAVLILQGSTFLEILTPLVPQLFLLLASISNIGKNMSWIATSASRAQMHNSFTLTDNLGDVTAKTTSQSVAASLVGTALGVAMAPLIGTSSVNVMIAFAPLALLNVYANYRSNQYVRMRTLNVQRCELLILDLLLKHPPPPPPADSVCEYVQVPRLPVDFRLLTPADVCEKETFVIKYRSVFNVPLLLEPPLEDVVMKQSGGDGAAPAVRLEAVAGGANLARPEQYSIVFSGDRKGPPSVCLWYFEHAGPIDVLLGFFHACVLRHIMHQYGAPLLADRSTGAVAEGVARPLTEGQLRLMSLHSQRYVHTVLPDIGDALQASGWFVRTVYLGEGGARLDVD
eukprot:Opistho-2@80954